MKKQILKENINLLQKSIQTLRLSFNKCNKIGIKKEYTFEELESFDSLTSKFARTSDIFTQKALRSVFNLLRENSSTFIDMANKAEKLDLITNADDLIEIRDIRNEIAHEYIQEIIQELFKKVLDKTDVLFSCVEMTNVYINKKQLLKKWNI